MNTRPILVTGSEGLIGRALTRALRDTVGLDLRGVNAGDVRTPSDVVRAMRGCRGVIHLAAVSRVIWGEQDPDRCREVNLGGTRQVLSAALASRERPWVIFASSREVYGQASKLPVNEDAPLSPLNVYGRTKAEGERLVLEARASGLRTAVLRFSNVYGGAQDHADRVIPAFVRAALCGAALRLDGADSTFDFTHVSDVVRGVLATAALLDHREAPPPLHLVTGVATTLGELATLVCTLTGAESPLRLAPARSFDVDRFCGDPRRARAVLGWEAHVGLHSGIARLAAELRPKVVRREAARA